MLESPDPAPAVRREDLRFVTGRGHYVGDLARPGMLHAAFVRSPHPHARVLGIDATEARSMPGVVAVYTGDDLASDGLADIPAGVDLRRPDGAKPTDTPRPLLVRDTARHLGEPVAVVIADTPLSAADGAEAVQVDYESRPAVAALDDALHPGAPLVWDMSSDNIAFYWSSGDVEAVEACLRTAAHVTQRDFTISRVIASPIEPRAALGEVDDDGRLVLYASHQNPYQLRDLLARTFGVETDGVRVIAPDVGGSFGMKAALFREDVAVLWAARRLGRPVRWISDRAEAFLSDDHARDLRISAALGLDEEGRFLALHVRYDINVGCYVSGRSLAPLNNFGGIAGVYRTPLIAAEARGVLTHTPPTAPYRGAGRPEATYAIERIIDAAARELELDPLDLRRRNLIPADAMPFKTGLTFTYDCGDFAANVRDAADLAELASFPDRRRAAARRGRLLGIGVCNPVEAAGGPFGRPAKDLARLEVQADGTVTLRTGVMSVGQGHETALPEFVSGRFGIPVDKVRYAQGDTDQLATGRGSGGSSAFCVGGSAISIAVDAAIEQGRALAAEHLEAGAADIEYRHGSFTVVGTDRTVSLGKVAELAGEPSDGSSSLVGTATFQPGAVTFPNGCHVCEVEIDPETGIVSVLRYVAVEDVGHVLNPTLVHGQIHGGVAQGIGQALKELIVHDPEAQLLSGSFMDYGLPIALDMPPITVALREVPTAVNPLGAKGVGEAGTVGALAATMNAVCDALAPLGISHIDMPATPGKVWAAIQAAGGDQALKARPSGRPTTATNASPAAPMPAWSSQNADGDAIS